MNDPIREIINCYFWTIDRVYRNQAESSLKKLFGEKLDSLENEIIKQAKEFCLTLPDINEINQQIKKELGIE